MNSALVVVGLLGVVTVIYWSTLNWRRSIQAALVLAILEGALRKWALPQASHLIYFLKDFVLLGAYVGYFFFTSTKQKRGLGNSIVTNLVYLITIWCTFEVLNPRLGSPLIAVLGVKNYLFYLPLLWLIPALFPSEEKLYKFLRAFLLLLIPVGVLAIAQFFSPIDSPLNTYVPDSEALFALAGDGKSARVTGTFSYIAGYAVYLGICITLILPFLSLRQSFPWRQATVLEILLVAITLFMTGSRGLLISTILTLVAYLGLQGFTNFERLKKTIRQFAVPGVISVLAIVLKFRSAVEAFWLRATQSTNNSSDLATRIADAFLEPFRFVEYGGILGYGPGTTFQGTEFLRNLLNLPASDRIPVYYEAEMGRVMLELGAIGFILWYGLRITLLLMTWKVYYQIKRPFLRQLTLSIFLFQSFALMNQIVFIHTANLYYWFLVGFVFLLPRLEKIERLKAKAYQTERYARTSYLPDTSY